MVSELDKLIFALRATETYDNRPGGKIVDRFQLDGQGYVLVEFEKSPGELYVFWAD